jgi:TonB family protein
MVGPLLYRPSPKWHVWAALGGAAMIHFAAAVIAGIHREPPPVDLAGIPDAVVIATFEQQPPDPEPTPPPEEPDIPPPPPPQVNLPEFTEEQPTPPPQKPKNPKPVAPIAKPKPVGVAGPMSMSSAKALAVFGPRPEYPYEARRSKITGSGVCVISVDSSSGNATDASMAQSTGNPILDNSAVTTFRRWRFKPGTVSRVKVPITFTMSGASF